MAARLIASLGLLEKGRSLWERVSSRRSAIEPAAPPESIPAELKIPALERRLGHLEDEASASFEVVSSMAQQHSQLAEQHAEVVQVVERLLQRTRLLLWTSGVLAFALIALAAAVLIP